jgi:sigma-B regulation protein RsbU (phosphoserine phosphatase)
MKSKYSVGIIVTVAVLLQLISAVQFLFARRGILEDEVHRAETELRVKNLEIQKVMATVETAIRNTLWTAERTLEQPDSLFPVIRRMVEQNPTIVGGGLMFEPDYYPQKGHWFEPYVARRSDGSIEEAQIGSASHNYLEAEFYQNGIKAGKGRWSEPYFDEAGARMMLFTYTIPVHDSRGEIVGLFGADVSLEWLSDVINTNNIYPNSFNVVISRTGKVMVAPDDGIIMRRTIQEFTASAADTTIRIINRQMMSGESGHKKIVGLDGQKKTIFYAPIEGEAGWSMAVVCNDKDIYSGLREMGLYLMMLMLAGMALLGFIIYRTARSARSLREASAEKERVDSELRIARGIQESMLPKTFPPFSERKDVDIYASLVPAKEVGGDLYDFNIRDEKLFFCIGDVAGKGVPASLVMAVTRSLFRIVSDHEDQPETIVMDINESLFEMNDSDMFVTLFVGVLDLATGLLRYCNAGHEEPLLIGKGVGLLPSANNIPVGLMQGRSFEGQDAYIYPGTTIFLYTDGLTEAEDVTHAQYGKQRLTRTARQALASNKYDPETIVKVQTDALHSFVGNAEQSDDLTMLAIRYNEAES